MDTSLEVLFTPADFAALCERDLRQTVCVVFDVLRATSSMVVALGNGAEALLPVSEIPEALAVRREHPAVLLAGERQGVRIRADQTGSVDFDFGNSPREFTAERVRGRTLVMSTTNGTRALRACAKAQAVLVSCFLNLDATVQWLGVRRPAHLLVVCSGTFEQAALEDTLAAGALSAAVWPWFANGRIADSAEIARQVWLGMSSDLPAAVARARNGRRLLANHELREDVAYCLRRDTVPLVAGLVPDGTVRRLADA